MDSVHNKTCAARHSYKKNRHCTDCSRLSFFIFYSFLRIDYRYFFAFRNIFHFK